MFLYASTICRYVLQATDPIRKLEDVTSSYFRPRPGDFTILDSLYRGIVAKAYAELDSQDLAFLRKILSTLLSLRSTVSLAGLSTLLKVGERIIRKALSGLSSVAILPPTPSDRHFPVSFFHDSFPEFLTQEDRLLVPSLGTIKEE